MSIGKMRHRVLVRQLATGKDSAGQPLTGWVDFASIWADVRFARGLEVVRAERETNIVNGSMRVRRRSDITEKMQLVYSGKTYKILSILPQSNVYMDLVIEGV